MRNTQNKTIDTVLLEKKEDITTKKQNPPFELDNLLEGLEEYGGIYIIETLLGVKYLKHKIEKNTFTQLELQHLITKITTITKIISESKNTDEVFAKINKIVQDAETLEQQYITNVLKTLRPLEIAYRSLEQFFKNAKGSKIYVTVVPVSYDQILGESNGDYLMTWKNFRAFIERELKLKFDRLNRINRYDFLLIPGFLKNRKVIHYYAEMAYDHRAMLLTDFEDCPNYDILLEEIEKAKLSGPQRFLTHAIVFTNYLIARKAFKRYGETENFTLPPSMAIAGLMARIPIAQVAASLKGRLKGALGTKIDFLHSELSELYSTRTIPVTSSFEEDFAFSDRNLLDPGQEDSRPEDTTYTIVRVRDKIENDLATYMNKKTFTNYDYEKREIKTAITNYLESIQKGLCDVGKELIASFNLKIARDKTKPKMILVKVDFQPLYPISQAKVSAVGGINALETGKKMDWGSNG